MLDLFFGKLVIRNKFSELQEQEMTNNEEEIFMRMYIKMFGILLFITLCTSFMVMDHV
jgi:hypothetical protein